MSDELAPIDEKNPKPEEQPRQADVGGPESTEVKTGEGENDGEES